MHKTLKIAVIGARGIPNNYSGIEQACEGLYSALANRGHNITVYRRSDGITYKSSSYRGIRLRTVPSIRSKRLGTLSHSAASLVYALSTERFDIIHLHALAPCIFSGFCRACRVATVATVHGLDWQRAKWKGLGAKVLKLAEASMVRNVSQILVVSQALQEYYANRYGRETIYMPNGVEPVDEAEYGSSTVLRDLGLESGGYVLYLGRLVPEKRLEDFVAAYREIRSPYRLVIAGESSPTNNYVSDLRRQAAPDGRIVFVGLQQRAAVHQLLQHAAVFVSPSALEGLPMSLLECMQHGTPAVVSDIPGHRELLGGLLGYDLFFPAMDVGALRTKLKTALANLGEYRRIAQEGRLVVARQHSWPKLAERTEAVFFRALNYSLPTKQMECTYHGHFPAR